VTSNKIKTPVQLKANLTTTYTKLDINPQKSKNSASRRRNKQLKAHQNIRKEKGDAEKLRREQK